MTKVLQFIGGYLEDVAVSYVEDTKAAFKGNYDPPPGTRLVQRRKARRQEENDEEMYGV